MTHLASISSEFNSDSIQGGGTYKVIGQADQISTDDLATLDRVCRMPPSSERDYKQLLAEINKRASLNCQPVSEACNSAYLAPEGLSSNSTPYFHEGADLDLNVQPMIFQGLDMTDWFQNVLDQFCEGSDQGISRDDIQISKKDDLLEGGYKPDSRLTKPKKK